MISSTSTLIDVALQPRRRFCTGISSPFAVGGSAAAFYCHTYRSLDADFDLHYHVGRNVVDDAVSAIGFSRNRGGIYTHPNSRFTVEFRAGPIAVGRKLIAAWRTERRADQTLNVLEPEDVICDRFLQYWAWGDRSARRVAIRVARSTSVLDLSRIDAWAAEEMQFDPRYERATWTEFRRELS